VGKHDELIARLEAATEGSRELDLALFRELGAPLPDSFGPLKLDLTWQADGTATMPVGDMQVRYTPPACTTSLDAILVTIGRLLPGYCFNLNSVNMSAILSPSPIHMAAVTVNAASLPLALCIALLRALSREAGHAD
jgi:hypothetical protein